jgi:hypothetical protein
VFYNAVASKDLDMVMLLLIKIFILIIRNITMLQKFNPFIIEARTLLILTQEPIVFGLGYGKSFESKFYKLFF